MEKMINKIKNIGITDEIKQEFTIEGVNVDVYFFRLSDSLSAVSLKSGNLDMDGILSLKYPFIWIKKNEDVLLDVFSKFDDMDIRVGKNLNLLAYEEVRDVVSSSLLSQSSKISKQLSDFGYSNDRSIEFNKALRGGVLRDFLRTSLDKIDGSGISSSKGLKLDPKLSPEAAIRIAQIKSYLETSINDYIYNGIEDDLKSLEVVQQFYSAPIHSYTGKETTNMDLNAPLISFLVDKGLFVEKTIKDYVNSGKIEARMESIFSITTYLMDNKKEVDGLVDKVALIGSLMILFLSSEKGKAYLWYRNESGKLKRVKFLTDPFAGAPIETSDLSTSLFFNNQLIIEECRAFGKTRINYIDFDSIEYVGFNKNERVSKEQRFSDISNI